MQSPRLRVKIVFNLKDILSDVNYCHILRKSYTSTNIFLAFSKNILYLSGLLILHSNPFSYEILTITFSLYPFGFDNIFCDGSIFIHR